MSRPSDLKFAVICSSNMNRSMEAHAYLAKKNYSVQSFGTGDKVKLPGTSADRPNCYEFGVSYEHIYNDLSSKDKHLFGTFLKKLLSLRKNIFQNSFTNLSLKIIKLFAIFKIIQP